MILEAIAIFILSLVPSLVSLLLLQKATQKLQARLRHAQSSTDWQQQQRIRSALERLEGDYHYLGDQNCLYNARSPYLRCAVNPDGPCEDCSYFQPKHKDKG